MPDTVIDAPIFSTEDPSVVVPPPTVTVVPLTAPKEGENEFFSQMWTQWSP